MALTQKPPASLDWKVTSTDQWTRDSGIVVFLNPVDLGSLHRTDLREVGRVLWYAHTDTHTHIHSDSTHHMILEKSCQVGGEAFVTGA